MPARILTSRLGWPKVTVYYLTLSLTTCSSDTQATVTAPYDRDYLALSQAFLKGLKAGEPVDTIVEEYANLDFEALAAGVDTKAEKLAFWINTYNGFVIYLLQDDPSRFDDRGRFFTRKQIAIAGKTWSLDNIEHDIIRDSRVKWGLGYLQKWFVDQDIKALRITDRDPRIHFALNCGAKSCPPVAIYSADRIDEQLDTISRRYLEQVTTVDGRKVTTTPLCSWFRGDFGGRSGVKKMLVKYDVIDTKNSKKIKFGNYDWTLSIGNYTDL